MKRLSALVIAGALLVSQTAFAQDHDHAAHAAQPAAAQSGGMQGMRGGNMMMQPGDMMQGMQGMHMMPSTVSALDSKTGLVDVTSGSMVLKLHFPPPSLAGLKVGDKISVHLGFSKS